MLQISLRFRWSLCALWILGLPAAGLVHADEKGSLDFAQDVAPILAKNCVACHNKQDAEGGLNLESHEALMHGGESGLAVVANDLDASLLLARVLASDEPMPPEDNTVDAQPLTEKQVDVLRAWIEAGAPDSAASPKPVIQWRALPEQVQPSYAIANSADGQQLAFGRGTRIEVQTQLSGLQQTTHLVDTSLPRPDAAHLDIVQSLAISPDSQRIASGGYRCVKIWRRSAELSEVLGGLASNAQYTAFSPDAEYLAYVTDASVLEIVDLKAGRAERYLNAHAAPITSLAWDADNHRIWSCDASGSWIVTHVATSQWQQVHADTAHVAVQLTTLPGLPLIGLRRDGSVFTSTLDSDNKLLVNDVGSFSQVTAITAVPGESPTVALAEQGGRVVLVNVETGAEFGQFDTQQQVTSLVASGDGSQLLILSDGGLAQLWSIAETKRLASFEEDYVEAKHTQTTTRNAARQQAKLARLDTQLPELKKASEKEAEALKKVEEAKQVAAKALTERVAELEAANTGLSDSQAALVAAQAAVAAATKQVEAAKEDIAAKKKAAEEAATKKKAAEAELAKREQARATSAESAERAAQEIPELEQKIASEKVELESLLAAQVACETASSQPDTVRHAFFNSTLQQICLVGTDRILRIFSSHDFSPLANLEMSSDTQAVAAVDGGSLLTFHTDGQLRIWNPQFPWILERTLGSDTESPFSDRIAALDFSPDGRLLAIGSGPPSRFGDLKILEVATGKVVRDFGEVHSDTILGVRFSPDSKQLATAAADKLCRLFDVESGQMARAFEGHTHHVLGVAWRDSGESLATASADGSIKLWRVETGEQLRTISGFSKEVSGIAFVGDTPELISASTDGIVRLHNADDGKQVRDFRGASEALYGLSLSADRSEVSASGQAGDVWTWRIDNATLVEPK